MEYAVDMIIRQASPADAPAFARIYGPFVKGTAISFETEPPTPQDFEGRIRSIGSVYPWFAAEEGGGILGYAYASRHKERAAYRFSVDFAVYVDPSSQRRGVGKALYGRLIAAVRDLGYYNAYGVITLPNEKSVAFHEAFGFEPIGVFRNAGYKLGAWRDVGWWHLALREPDEKPEEPRPVSCLESRG